mgnify:CR=1 FL=1
MKVENDFEFSLKILDYALNNIDCVTKCTKEDVTVKLSPEVYVTIDTYIFINNDNKWYYNLTFSDNSSNVQSSGQNCYITEKDHHSLRYKLGTIYETFVKNKKSQILDILDSKEVKTVNSINDFTYDED